MRRGRCNMLVTDSNGSWRCNDLECLGERPDCEARARNDAEAHWLAVRERDDAWENAWRKALGLPVQVLTIDHARYALRLQRRAA